jgi:cellulose synthase/poly-beta-1,6-N-acetylglucosamine synthase-like glycosyltransferase
MIVCTGINAAEWFFLLYFIALNGGYLVLNMISLFALRHAMESRMAGNVAAAHAALELPVTIIVPAHNEAITIGDSVRALLQLEYPQYEIIVVNDGSSDETLDVLKQEFSLQIFPEAYRLRLPVEPVRGIYRSTVYGRLRVIDKCNGGKADALNAGLNAARYPIFCGVDADSILQRDSLQKVIQPFLDDPSTIAVGGTVRIANGCEVRGGFVERIRLPQRKLALFQIVEYLRAFLFGRLGWSPLNALLIVSGAFGLFRKEAVISVGGYRRDTIGEDMDLVVRLHRKARLSRQQYRITFVPDPICWTEAPENWRTLRSQRMRWQRGLAESLSANWRLCFHPRGGAPGWIAYPFMLVFELLGPLIEVSGLLFIVVAALLGDISYTAFALFLIVAIGVGILLSISALLLEELSFHVYPRFRDTAVLLLAAVAENFGYRQVLAFWRAVALLKWIVRSQAQWGKIQRTASWRPEAAPKPRPFQSTSPNG